MKIKMKFNLLLLFGLLFFAFVIRSAIAADSLALTITPPIIKNNISPGQIWKSYIKVVNNNNVEIDAYVDLMNFESDGETGTVKLTPKDPAEISENPMLINNWIVIDRGPIKVPANQSAEIPFIVDVPDQVDPGDHHLAFLIGTRPNGNKGEGSSIKVSSMLGSLLLLNVSGDVNESGVVREFLTDKQVYGTGDTKFTLRFENTGNTILQPQGEIKIFDWRDRDKGSVSINQKTNTGNVFPKDTRKWEYKWPVPNSLLEMGRYRADLVLHYGNVSETNSEETVYFWVIQWRPLLIVLGSFLLFILILIIMVRRYIRNAIIRTQSQIEVANPRQVSTVNRGKVVNDMQAVVDLKAKPKTIPATVAKRRVKKNGTPVFKKLILIFSIALLLVVALFIYFYLDTMETKTIPLEELQIIQETKENVELERNVVATTTSEQELEEIDIATSTEEILRGTSAGSVQGTSSEIVATSTYATSSLNSIE